MPLNRLRTSLCTHAHHLAASDPSSSRPASPKSSSAAPCPATPFVFVFFHARALPPVILYDTQIHFKNRFDSHAKTQRSAPQARTDKSSEGISISSVWCGLAIQLHHWAGSGTGYLHIANLKPALFPFLFVFCNAQNSSAVRISPS